MWPQVPAEQRTQRLWCGECFVSESIGIDEVAEEMGWSEGRCPDCAPRQAPQRVPKGEPRREPAREPREAATP